MELTTILTLIVSVVAGVAYASFFFRYLTRWRPVRRERPWEQAKQRFFEELTDRVSLGVIRSVEDALQIQRTVQNEVESYRFASTPIDVLLEGYLSVITGSVKEIGEQVAGERYAFVQKLIDAKRAAEPFSSLPARERVAAHILQEAIESNNKDAALSRLQELASALGARLDEANRKATRNLVLSVGALLVAATAIPVAIVF